MNAAQVKKAAKKFGADLVGIAPISRLAHLPKESNPLSIFPEAKSVIVIGRRILRGSLRGVEEGTSFDGTYHSFGFRFLEDNFLSKTTYDLNCWIEAQGFEAVPLFSYDHDGSVQAVPVAPGKPAPNVYLKWQLSAQAAGLGEIGLGGLFLTPEFGHRQRFATLLTDQELEADPVMPPKTICNKCKACIEACPLNAYAKTTHKEGIPGSECTVADLDDKICAKCENGAWILPGRFDHVDRCAASCGRACLVALETKGALSNKFDNVFRKRSVWKRSVPGRAK
jgi:epoxyqueuosine reductase QueG